MESSESLSCLICIFTYLINYSEGLTYYIPEAQPVGTLIGNIAYDEGIRATVSEEVFKDIKFHFLSSEDEYVSYFSLNSSTSDLKVKTELDRESMCRYSSDYLCEISVDVVAQSDLDSFFQEITVTILIRDINDHPPIFPRSYLESSMSESEVLGKKTGLDQATDKDSSNYTVKSYKLFPETAPFTAQYEEVDGVWSLSLVVSGQLDREKTDRYILKLVAFDGGDPPLNGTQTINLTITDANDNTPSFNRSVYHVTVNETIQLNTSIITVTATDLDLGKNAEIVYGLSNEQAQDIKDKFAINATSGEIKIIQHLEYTGNSVIKVKVTATDKGDRPLSSTATVEVTVEDTENNPPEIKINLFSDTGAAEVREYAGVGVVVAHVSVVDNDANINGMVTCSVTSDYFLLQKYDSNKYKVTVLSSLDRETIPQHNVTVVCHDYGVPWKTSEESFLVNVIDENDNPPIFTMAVYDTSLKETDRVNTAVIQVLARDKDIGNNGRITYSLEPEFMTNFSINSDTGLITAKIPLDRETKDSYNIMVMAKDAGRPQLSSSASVHVTIEDINDNAPVFIEDPFTLHTPEGQPKETVLGKVVARDDDLAENKYVTYALQGNHSGLPFTVLPDGTVKSKETLDREVKAQYEFKVMAIDNGIDIRLNSTATVVVNVNDINDNDPVIVYPRDPGIVRYVTFMTPSQTQIMKIEATDADSDLFAELMYRISKRNDSNIFEIGRNGEIYVARRLQESDINVYSLEVVVTDKGNPPRSAVTEFNIQVIAKNVTDFAKVESNNMNVVIAIVVVVVTVIVAALILLSIWIVRRHDLRKKKKYAESTDPHQGADNDSGFSSTGGRKSPDTVKIFESSMLPTCPQLVPVSQGKDKPDAKTKDVKFQDEIHIREKSIDSATEQSTVQLHRLASLRLHQALIQNYSKPWISQAELPDSSKEGKRQEDHHSDLSVDTATYDSGIGGSVSDTGDLRLAQLQQIVRQSGRRGKPPHKSAIGGPSKPPRIIVRGRSEATDVPPERPPPMKNNPYRSTSPVQNHVTYSPTTSPIKFITSSPTPVSPNQVRFGSVSPTKINNNHMQNMSQCHSPSRNVVQDLLMYKKFQNGLHSPHGRLVDESVDTTQFDDDGSTTSGSYYIDQPLEDLQHPPVSDIYV